MLWARVRAHASHCACRSVATNSLTRSLVQGAANRGACKKCGEIGHLAFQCFNMLAGKKQEAGDISSTSSDFDEEEERKRCVECVRARVCNLRKIKLTGQENMCRL